MIQTERVGLTYLDHGREVHACQDVSIRVERGEFVGILGPSGSGKSSLLYLMSGLKTPTSGQVLVHGDDLHAMTDESRAKLRLREFGFVFQHPYLLGYLSAFENVLLARPGEDRGAEALELLDVLGLQSKADRKPHELSGGERQRVCVARALLGRPAVIFADEPTASLDHRNGEVVVDLLNRYRGEGALVMVTHDPSMLKGADRVLHLVDGAMVEEGLG